MSLYCIELHLLYCPVLHCSKLPPSINPFAVDDDDDYSNNNNNNNNNVQSGTISESSMIANVCSNTFTGAA